MPYTESNGVKIYYEDYGKGETIVLISGLGSPLGSWDTQIPIYSKNFRVIVFDNRGVGRSEVTEPGFTIEDMADDTVGLLDSLNVSSASFIGKSMGGMITQWIGIKHPDRVNKLVIGCSSASRDEVGDFLLRSGRDVAVKAGMKTVWATSIFFGYTRDYIENNIESIKSSLDEIPEDDSALKGYIGQSRACEGHHSIDKINLIGADTLVMYGDRDLIMSPQKSLEMAEKMQNCELRCFKGVGHGFWRERQKEVDETVLGFLS